MTWSNALKNRAEESISTLLNRSENSMEHYGRRNRKYNTESKLLNPDLLNELGVQVINSPPDPKERGEDILKIIEDHHMKTGKWLYFDEV